MSADTPRTAPAPPLATARTTRRRQARRMSYERRILLLTFICGLPGFVSTSLLLASGGYPLKVHVTVLAVVITVWAIIVGRLLNAVVRPLQTASNMLAALREGDYSLQAGHIDENDALGQVMLEINQLTRVLREHKMGAIEAATLLNKVVEEIDVVVMTFDPKQRLRMVNKAGCRFLDCEEKEAAGKTAAELGLGNVFQNADSATIQEFATGRPNRWMVRVGRFREGGEEHALVLLTDLSRTLREEERNAWKRLIRVLGHELNNSMAPIKSLTSSLRKIVVQDPKPEDWEEDVTDGLEVIEQRAESLSVFMNDYARLAKLPPPNRSPQQLGPLVERVASLSQRMPVTVEPGPPVTVAIDAAQIEQLLINITKNAVEASLETGGGVTMSWEVHDARVEVRVCDEGPGIANPQNLFIPFFSTKKEGSGIGLTLSRQIAEGHEGELTLDNRDEGQGCVATLTLPLQPLADDDEDDDREAPDAPESNPAVTSETDRES